MSKQTVPSALLFIALSLGAAIPSSAGVVSTIAEFNGAPSFDFTAGDYPLSSVLIGNFSFSIPTGYTVVGGSVSGYFGNDDVSVLTAPSDYYIDNGAIEVASCDDSLTMSAVCDSTATSETPWTYTFTSADLAALSTEIAAGSIDFTVVQNYAIAVQTDTTTLNLVLSPEPATGLAFFGGLAGIALLRRFRKA